MNHILNISCIFIKGCLFSLVSICLLLLKIVYCGLSTIGAWYVIVYTS